MEDPIFHVFGARLEANEDAPQSDLGEKLKAKEREVDDLEDKLHDLEEKMADLENDKKQQIIANEYVIQRIFITVFYSEKFAYSSC